MPHLLARATSVLFLLVLPAAAPGYERTDSYELRQMDGWTVRVSSKLVAEKPLAEQVLRLLQVRLFEMERALPRPALARLRDVTVWVELDDPRFPGMCFHPSRDWLSDNGYNPDKAGGVEIGNAQHFLDWADEQPCMVLHEFAHAYHHKVLGARNRKLLTAFNDAVSSGKYADVLRASGKTERSYALNNADEFFAELSESYFGTNDFYPFVRAELREYDRRSFDLFRELWTNPPPAQPSSAPTTNPSIPTTQPVTRRRTSTPTRRVRLSQTD
jgi:hypothetical protein